MYQIQLQQVYIFKISYLHQKFSVLHNFHLFQSLNISFFFCMHNIYSLLNRVELLVICDVLVFNTNNNFFFRLFVWIIQTCELFWLLKRFRTFLLIWVEGLCIKFAILSSFNIKMWVPVEHWSNGRIEALSAVISFIWTYDQNSFLQFQAIFEFYFLVIKTFSFEHCKIYPFYVDMTQNVLIT